MTSSVAQGCQLLRKELKQAAPHACLPQSIGKANMATKATSPLEQNLPRFHSEQNDRKTAQKALFEAFLGTSWAGFKPVQFETIWQNVLERDYWGTGA